VATPGRTISRSPLVLVAGALLILSGIVGAIGFARVLVSGAGLVEVVYLVVALIVAVLSVYAGWLVLHQDERGRSLGLVLAVIGLVLALLSLIQGSGVFIVPLAVDAFLIYVLTTRAREFA
jgi:4-amino-4-deoxy-L-arabinose transferase-like glycosyltransferase